MLTQPQKKVEQSPVFVNPIQESPQRTSIYAINRCEDQVIGFEFVSTQYSQNLKCFNNVIVNLCVPIDIITPINIKCAEFKATSDPCFKDWEVEKKDNPQLEIQRDSSNHVSGILVRFGDETCCFPNQMSFRLIARDYNDCVFSIAQGLLIFR